MKALIYTFCLLVAGLSDPVRGEAQSRPDTVPVQLQHYNSRLSVFRKAPVTVGKTMFLGDDVIERGNWQRMLKDSTVVQRGISGDNTFGVLNRLEEAARFKPGKIIIQVGANDLARGLPVARVLENLFTIAGQAHARVPSAQVVMMGLLPFNGTVKNFPAVHPRDEDIRELNGQLKKYQEVIKYTFVDVYTPLLDQQNNLHIAYTIDGVHLNLAGYQVLLEQLKKQKLL
ncbi:MAG TPA: GDSL-type esterase/lipase family protein [Cyclobacteriaceae bacterium]|nr:GDSL-type esterase/lipase family protein [Cyclobacteriaceae bacterium]